MSRVKERIRIGLVTTVLPTRRSIGGKSVSTPILHFRRIAEHAAKNKAQVLLFAPGDVDWNAGKVDAWVPERAEAPSDGWTRVRSNLPDVMYENVFVHLAMKGFAVNLRREARQRKIPVFNPPMFNKWVMGKWLASTSASPYIPPAIECTSADAAIRHVDKWKDAYLKPTGGYGGMGVTRIQALPSGEYRVSVDRQSSGSRVRRRLSRTQLLTFIKSRLNRPHMLQRGLQLLQVNGRKVDFRAVVHRDINGDWKFVGLVPKVAAADGVVTNLVAGGERMSMGQLSALARRERASVKVKDLEGCAINLAKVIGRRFPTAGLLGFDLGMDDSGKVWMIEVNPKPARSLLSDEMKRKCAAYAAEFSVYLAKRKSAGC